MTRIKNNFNEIGIFCLEKFLKKKNLDNFYQTLLNISYFHLKKAGEHSSKLMEDLA